MAPIASPLTIIRQAAGVDRRAGELQEYEEALLLSYTVDFGFLDAVAVALLRSTGARVTVVGDVAMANFDPRSAPRAGREFNAAYAQCPAAFHPKLFVLASDTHAHIAIGSGNATMAGWFHNRELWTVITCTPDERSPLAAQLADWLDGVAATVRFSAGVEDRLINVAGLLRQTDSTLAEAATRHTLVSSLNVPIIDQLPVGPVDELRVFAPFFDPDAAALMHLIERLQPGTIEVLVQSSLAQFDGSAVLAAIRHRHGVVLDDTDTRYRHGKLVEWVRDGRRWALTGSANLSRAALLRSQRGGGNCELGIVSEIAKTLMPTSADKAAPDLIRSIVPPPRTTQTDTAPLLLGAHRSDRGVDIELASAPRDSARVQYTTRDADQWSDLTAALVEERTLGATSILAPGTRIRLLAHLSGTIAFSNVVAVADLAATASRRAPGSATRAPKFSWTRCSHRRCLNVCWLICRNCGVISSPSQPPAPGRRRCRATETISQLERRPRSRHSKPGSGSRC